MSAAVIPYLAMSSADFPDSPKWSGMPTNRIGTGH